MINKFRPCGEKYWKNLLPFRKPDWICGVNNFLCEYCENNKKIFELEMDVEKLKQIVDKESKFRHTKQIMKRLKIINDELVNVYDLNKNGGNKNERRANTE